MARRDARGQGWQTVEAEAWLRRKVQMGRLLSLPTYYPEPTAPGHRPEKYARRLLADLSRPDRADRRRAELLAEARAFRDWAESNPQSPPIHPVRGPNASTPAAPVAPAGVTWVEGSASVDPAARPAPSFGKDVERSAASRWATAVLVVLSALWIAFAFWTTTDVRLQDPPMRPVLWAAGLGIFAAIGHQVGLFDAPRRRLPRPARPREVAESKDRGVYDRWVDG